MFFGTFGSVFLLTQFFQIAQGLGPLEAGPRTLPWTAMPMLVAPIAGILSDRIGSRPLMVAGLALQSVAIFWLGRTSAPDDPLRRAHRAARDGGAGHGARLRPQRERGAVVRPPDRGRPGVGATNAIREVGGVMGVAVLAEVFAANGGYTDPQAFTDGVSAALPIGAAVLAAGALAALLVPGRRRAEAPAVEEREAMAASAA